MKQKHLAVALSAIFATVALAGCGSDNDSNYVAPTTPTTPTTPDTDTDNPIDNPGDAAEDGDRAAKSSVLGQQYIRGSDSDFDTTNNSTASNDGNNTVVGYVPLQNTNMTNIVVAQYDDVSNLDANGKPNKVKYILGSTTSDVAAGDSLQSANVSNLENAFVNVRKTQDGADVASYDINNLENKVGTKAGQFGIDANGIQNNNGSVRIFGAQSSDTASENADATFANSAQFINLKAAVVTDGADTSALQRNVKGIHLNNVQYGRVTGALDSLNTTDLEGKAYVQGDLANKVFGATASDLTDVYFYRGNNATSIEKMAALQVKGGTYQYAGHALMYGIDNSFDGTNVNGESNSVGINGNAAAVGNFVQATYNATDKEVTGSVYNVWDKGAANTDGNFTKVDLVQFDGNVIGNSIKGDANLTYGNVQDSQGSFKGSFFGDNAQELGGAFNSINSTTGYGDSKWGGVFGAQLVAADVPTTPTTPTDPIITPPTPTPDAGVE